MDIKERISENIYIMSISGRIDTANAKEMEAKLNDVVDNNWPKIIINLTAVDYISSSGLRALLAAFRRQEQKKGTLLIVSNQPFVENIFKITGLDRVFIICITEEGAIRGLS
jgi:anti-anti-sigma factor